MPLSRRQFFSLASRSVAGAVLLSPLQACYAQKAFATGVYGPLQGDPKGILDLPPGFSYVRLSEAGQTMSDGYKVPGKHDGMAAFPGANNTTILIRNHELKPSDRTSVGAPDSKKYDSQCKGGTTTLVVGSDLKVIEQYGSLAGTYRNCSGARTPWNTWLTCEESVATPSSDRVNKKHGYVYEVPVSATGLVNPVPLTAMGRFNHEAAPVDPDTGYVYMTEDRGDSLFYRFVPSQKGNLSAGGDLYALKIAGIPKATTKTGFAVGQPMAVEWVKIDEPDPDTDTVRVEGFDKGAATFSRGEGAFYSGNYVYFCCTNGGRSGDGQIWHYSTVNNTIELYLEPNNSGILNKPDGIVLAPNGHLFVGEDGPWTNYIVGATPTGQLYQFARNAMNGSEFGGLCFSPDSKTMFVNIYNPGITFAITGPW